MLREKLLRRLRNGAHLECEGDTLMLRQGNDRRRPVLMQLDKADVEGMDLPLRKVGKVWVLAEGPAESRDITDIWHVGGEGAERRHLNAAESPIACLLRHRSGDGLPFLEKRHVAALETLRDDHAQGYAQTGLTSNWSAFGAGGGGMRSGDGLPVHRLNARRRAQAALDCLDGALRLVIARACLEGTSLGVIEKCLRLPRRTAKDRVREGLDRLARFYGY